MQNRRLSGRKIVDGKTVVAAWPGMGGGAAYVMGSEAEVETEE